MNFVLIYSGSQTSSRPAAQEDQIFRRTTISSWVRRPADAQEIHYILYIEMGGRPNSVEGYLTFPNWESFRRPCIHHMFGTMKYVE